MLAGNGPSPPTQEGDDRLLSPFLIIASCRSAHAPATAPRLVAWKLTASGAQLFSARVRLFPTAGAPARRRRRPTLTERSAPRPHGARSFACRQGARQASLGPWMPGQVLAVPGASRALPPAPRNRSIGLWSPGRTGRPAGTVGDDHLRALAYHDPRGPLRPTTRQAGRTLLGRALEKCCKSLNRTAHKYFASSHRIIRSAIALPARVLKRPSCWH